MDIAEILKDTYNNIYWPKWDINSVFSWGNVWMGMIAQSIETLARSIERHWELVKEWEIETAKKIWELIDLIKQ